MFQALKKDDNDNIMEISTNANTGQDKSKGDTFLGSMLSDFGYAANCFAGGDLKNAFSGTPQGSWDDTGCN